MANIWFKCERCGHEEPRLLRSHVTVSETPCEECGGRMIRK